MNQTGQTPDISSNIDYTNYWTNNGCNSLPRFESHKEKTSNNESNIANKRRHSNQEENDSNEQIYHNAKRFKPATAKSDRYFSNCNVAIVKETEITMKTVVNRRRSNGDYLTNKLFINTQIDRSFIEIPVNDKFTFRADYIPLFGESTGPGDNISDSPDENSNKAQIESIPITDTNVNTEPFMETIPKEIEPKFPSDSIPDMQDSNKDEIELIPTSNTTLNLEPKIQEIYKEMENLTENKDMGNEEAITKDTNDQNDETIPWINGSVDEEISHSAKNNEVNVEVHCSKADEKTIEPKIKVSKTSNSNDSKKTKKQLEKEIIEFALLKANVLFTKNELMSGIFANKDNKTRSKNRNVLDLEKVEEIKVAIGIQFNFDGIKVTSVWNTIRARLNTLILK